MNRKRIFLFGATGQTGKELLKQALNEGHTVTAVARDPDKLEEFKKYDNFKSCKGDALERESFEGAMSDHDVVMSCLGSSSLARFSGTSFFEDAIRGIHESMKKKEINRFIGMSSWATQDDPNLPFFLRWILRPVFLKSILDSLCQMEQYIQTTKANYTIIRPGGLSNDPASEKEMTVVDGAQFVPDCTSSISRSDVATFMLTSLKTDQYDKKIVAIGIKK